MPASDEVPPGPAQLVHDAIASPESPVVDAQAGEDVAHGPNKRAVASASRQSSYSSDTKVTTVIQTTKESRGASKTTTDTLTHTGASDVHTDFSHDGLDIHLRPIPARGSSASKIKTRRDHTFEPRISHFDRYNRTSQADPFRGFFTLFWIFVAVGMVRLGLTGYRESGVPYRLGFARLMSQHALDLAISDGIMVGATFLSLPFALLVERGFLGYRWFGLLVQHVGQTLFLGVAIRWTFQRQWPWIQSGFMTLHTLTMLMKTHSYISFNGSLSNKRRRLERVSREIDQLVSKHGGLESCSTAAEKNWLDQRDATQDGAHAGNGSNGDKSLSAPTTLRRRHSQQRQAKPAVDSDSDMASSMSSLNGRAKASEEKQEKKDAGLSHKMQVLTWHPDERLSKLADEACELESHLTSNGPKKVRYPANLTLMNYIDYLLIPTLVYELEYPRTDKIRPLYVLEKALATFGTLSVLILVTEHFILPISPNMSKHSFVGAALDLAIPFMVNYLLIFYIIFECICNVFAEVTRFADRQFYQDWWNSTSFDEFSRKWNVPVHTFLLRHVYNSTRSEYKLSKFQAAFTTFLLSACVHELVMAVVTQKIRPYLFAMQMAQLPLIMVGRIKFFKKHPALGNLFFWIGLMAGFPMLAVAYIRM